MSPGSPNRPSDGQLWRVRELTDSAAPHGVEVPSSGGTVFWLASRAYVRTRTVNVIGSAVFADAFEFPRQAFYCPLLITSGLSEEPRAFASAEVRKAFKFLGFEFAHKAVES